MTKYDALTGGYVVISIRHLHGGNPGSRIKLENLPREKLPVGMVSDDVKNEGAQSNGECLHDRLGSDNEHGSQLLLRISFTRVFGTPLCGREGLKDR